MSDSYILQDDCDGDNRMSSRSDSPPLAIPECQDPEHTEQSTGLPEAAAITRTANDTSTPIARSSSSEVNSVQEDSEGNPEGASASETPADTEEPRSESAVAHGEGVQEMSLRAPDPRKIGQGDGGSAEVEAVLQQLADEIKQGHQHYELTTLDGLKHARYVGERLVQAKRLCPPRQFQQWLRQHCPKLKLRTARYYTWVCRNPTQALERSERKRQSVAARKRPAQTVAAATHSSSEQAAAEHRGDANCSPPSVDDRPDDVATGDLPEHDQTDGHVEAEINLHEEPIASIERPRAPRNPAPARPDSSHQGANGETPLERDGPSQVGDDGNKEPDDEIQEPTKAARFVHLCWDMTDIANDAIRELDAGADEQVVEDLRFLVPQAMKSLGEVALALKIESPAAMNSSEVSPSDGADHLAGPGHGHRDQADSEATPPPDGIVASPSREEHHEHDQS